MLTFPLLKSMEKRNTHVKVCDWDKQEFYFNDVNKVNVTWPLIPPITFL